MATLNYENKKIIPDNDPTAESRKKDHIELAFRSRITQLDTRFYYEPFLSAHPTITDIPPINFLNKTFHAPMWVSSMTGGTEKARTINKNLARACGEFGFGMGLGSCRQLLYSDEFLSDFDVRQFMGNEIPLFANLGVAQIEKLFEQNEIERINILLKKLNADGLIVHVNPLQEWLQPEGDRFLYPPIETIKKLLNIAQFPIIVKEVGQGFGPESIKTLLQLPIAALDLAAAGGTNFSKLELLRSSEEQQNLFNAIAQLGHTAEEMVNWINFAHESSHLNIKCRQIIISGGITDFLDGYYLTQKIKIPAVYGQASAFLKYAQGDYSVLQKFISSQLEGLALAYAFLKIR